MKDIYKQFGIYRITNVLDGVSYIGKTGMNFGDRWDSHRSLLNSGSHFNKQLQNAWTEFGEDSFEFQIIESVDDRNALDDLEVFYIAQYREADSCYNVQSGGDHGNAGIRMSDSAKEKIGEKNRINMTGKKASAETKQKMSESQRARYNSWTDEDRRRHGEMTSRCARGYKWGSEAKARFSQLQREKPNSAKYTADDIRAIRMRYEGGETAEALARAFDTSPSYIMSIIKRKRWAHI